ncbi:MAG: hypothetical protein VX704_05395, partial [Verrucomicrobiota bacterium]|nr:hypothetical protein [Verrucomicrobiota bacterium]
MGPRARGSTMSLRERAGGWSLEGRSPDGCSSSRAQRRGGRASHRETADDSSDNSSSSIFMNTIFGSIRFSFLSVRFQLLLVASRCYVGAYMFITLIGSSAGRWNRQACMYSSPRRWRELVAVDWRFSNNSTKYRRAQS